MSNFRSATRFRLFVTVIRIIEFPSEGRSRTVRGVDRELGVGLARSWRKVCIERDARVRANATSKQFLTKLSMGLPSRALLLRVRPQPGSLFGHFFSLVRPTEKFPPARKPDGDLIESPLPLRPTIRIDTSS